MRKIIIVILAIGIIVGLSNVSFAYPGSVTVDASSYSGSSWSYGLQDTTFEANIYEFSVASNSNAWSTMNIGTTNLPARGYLWSLYIYQSSTGLTYFLGDESYNGASDPNDGIFFPVDPLNPQDAITAAVIANLGDKVVIDHSLGGDLWFYINDPYLRDNKGSVTVGIQTTVVPEPISSTLFVVGGAFFAGRRYLKRKRHKKA